MTSQRVPYEDAATPTEMQSDCAAAEQELQLPHPRPVTYKAHPAPPPVQAPVVTDDLATRAAGMELHLG